MFTNEFEFDSTITTVMDELGEHEDVQLIIGDDILPNISSVLDTACMVQEFDFLDIIVK